MNLQFNTLPEGLLVTLIGLMIVFLGLVILIVMIGIITRLTSGIGEKKKEPKAGKQFTPASPAAPASAAVEQPAAVTAAVAANDQEEIIAAIAAALAMMDEGTSFRVRRVRRISNASAWNKAGREEQVYSRY